MRSSVYITNVLNLTSENEFQRMIYSLFRGNQNITFAIISTKFVVKFAENFFEKIFTKFIHKSISEYTGFYGKIARKGKLQNSEYFILFYFNA